MNRGVVIKLYGDQKIAGAIADGMTKVLEADSIQVVKREIHNQRVQRSLLRVAVNNTKTAQDYACMASKARCDYEYTRHHGRLYDTFLGLWGLLWTVIFEVYDYLSEWNRKG